MYIDDTNEMSSIVLEPGSNFRGIKVGEYNINQAIAILGRPDSVELSLTNSNTYVVFYKYDNVSIYIQASSISLDAEINQILIQYET